MESRAVLILLGFVGLTLLFQGATASVISSNVTRGGGTCVDTVDCCGAQNCATLTCDNSHSLTVVSIKNLNILCNDVLNDLTLDLISKLIKLVSAGSNGCDSGIAGILAGILGISKQDIDCCNFSGDTSGGGNGNCNAESNSCYAECTNVPSKGGSTTITNQCGSNCCSYSGC